MNNINKYFKTQRIINKYLNSMFRLLTYSFGSNELNKKSNMNNNNNDILKKGAKVNSKKVKIINQSNKVNTDEKKLNNPKNDIENNAIKKKMNNSNNLNKYLMDMIKTNKKPLTMSEYINECLFNQQYGYYSTKDEIFIKDFITSPEISPLFGETIAVFIIKQIESFLYPEKLDIVEIGPGRGLLSADIIKSLLRYNNRNYYSYILIEKSEKLKQKQMSHIFNSFIKPGNNQKYEVEKCIIKSKTYSFYNNNLPYDIETIEIKLNGEIKCRFIWLETLEDLNTIENAYVSKSNSSQESNSNFNLNAKANSKLK